MKQLNIPVYVGNKEICKEFNCSPATAVKIMKNVKVANKDKKNPYERKVPFLGHWKCMENDENGE